MAQENILKKVARVAIFRNPQYSERSGNKYLQALLGLRPDWSRRGALTWSCLGGLVQTESYLEAARREIQEEIGIVLSNGDLHPVRTFDNQEKDTGLIWRTMLYVTFLPDDHQAIFFNDQANQGLRWANTDEYGHVIPETRDSRSHQLIDFFTIFADHNKMVRVARASLMKNRKRS